MNRAITPGQRHGSVHIPASKSQAHRLLILAAFSNSDVLLTCDGLSNDITATAACLNALGATVNASESGIINTSPFQVTDSKECVLHCGESGSTLRFLLPICGALGKRSVFIREGRLPERPLEPFLSELMAHGMRFNSDGALLHCEGMLQSGSYSLPGNVSSQYITGLLMSFPFINGDSTLEITGNIESAAYITMTEQALTLAGIRFSKNGNTFIIPGNQVASLPEHLAVEGDWSNAAFFLSMGALSDKGMLVNGLNPASAQGDKAVIDILRGFGAVISETDNGVLVRKGALDGQMIDASPIPDLVPTLAVVASVCKGETRFVNAGRLRIKESDRLESTAALINALGGYAVAEGDTLIVSGVDSLKGGSVDSCNDHRIAMSSAVAACAATDNVTVLGSECVKKSYPAFWDDFSHLEGADE